ncbi:MAG TPA: SDR family NAD(P)-dependent oxidoreductase, partial [Candidatus Limnocylindria bacterium]|nr:SDR family NAD(P)-dependent oxidoreductase [Candidatus Limnocylindria bacterium]
MPDGSVVVIGGNRGIGREIAKHYADAGADVVITCTDEERARAACEELGGSSRGIALDLTRPESMGEALADVGKVRYLVLVAIDRDHNTVREYDVARAMHLVTLKLVGYTQVVHTLLDRMDEQS